MRSIIILAVYLAASTSALASAGIAHAVDGDTLTIGRERIRIFGIDAPEAQQTCRIRYSNWTCGLTPRGRSGRWWKANKLPAKPSTQTSTVGPSLGCHVGGLDVAAELVRSGMAVVYGRGGDLYGGIEAAAKGNRAGVWASEFEMPAA